MLKLGVHVSAAAGIYNSIDRAKNLGCSAMQIFARNPRKLRKTSLIEEDIRIFKKRAKKAEIKPVVIHIPYTLNLSASKYDFYKITIKEFILDLIEADKLGADFLVTHMGSYKGGIENRGVLRVGDALSVILKETKGIKTVVLLENTSGSGKWLGADFSHQRTVMEKLDWSDSIGICLDTAHAWAAGYKIDDAAGVENLLKDIDDKVGISRLKLIHLNDTREKLGSYRDKHFDIGEGNIGLEGFNIILNHPKLSFLREVRR